jgi:hypothetical protein
LKFEFLLQHVLSSPSKMISCGKRRVKNLQGPDSQ